MRIAMVVGTFPSTVDEEPGFPATWYFALKLKEEGHEVLVLTLHPETVSDCCTDVIEVAGITVFRKRIDFERYQAFSGLPSVENYNRHVARAKDLYEGSKKILEEFAPDLIECQEFNGLGFFFAAEKKYPLVVRCYGSLSQLIKSNDVGKYAEADTAMIEALELAPVAEADAVIVICRELAHRLNGLIGKPIEDFHVIRTAFVTPPGSPLKTSFAAGEDFPRIFFWGRVQRQKGTDTLIEALPAVLKQFPTAHLILGGNDCTEYGAFTSQGQTLRKRLDDLGLSEKVTFTGFLSREKIQELIMETDICVFPSRYETACYSLLEAQSCGACCVATSVGGLPEYQIAGETVILVEPKDPDALADGLIKLASDQKLRENLSRKGLENLHKVCDLGTNYDLSLKAYQQALTNFRARNSKAQNGFVVVAKCLGDSLTHDGEEFVLKKAVPWIAAGFDRGYDAAIRAAYSDAYQRGYDAGVRNREPLPVEPTLTSQIRGVAGRAKRKIMRGVFKSDN